MKTICIPANCDLDNFKFQITDYVTYAETEKQMISLQQNTFSFLQQGSKEVFSNNTSITIDNSHFLFLQKGNCLMTEKIAETSQQYKSVLFFFSDKAVLNFYQKYSKTTRSSLDKQQPVFSFKYTPYLQKFSESLLDISELSKELQTDLLQIKFEELMLYLTETQNIDFLPYFFKKEAETNFTQVIEANKLNKLSLTELAFLTNMSISNFKRKFKEYYNSTPSKWFLKQRLSHTAFLLKNTSKRPSDVFEIAGYETLSAFTQAYKAEFGTSPKQHI